MLVIGQLRQPTQIYFNLNMILLVLLLLHNILAKDVPRPNAKYVISPIDSCPVEGYYLKRQSAPNTLGPGDCYLCFCEGDDTAVCWLRKNKKCDTKSYHNQNVGKRNSRMRRSPISLGELFFKDAAKEVFNKQSPEVCKPFESSFSDGCPPEDWCIGCTVCDCDANGRWDCHVLSFCDDMKGKKQMKKRKTKQKVIKSNQKSIPKSTNKKQFKKPDTNKPPTNKTVKRTSTFSTTPPRHKKIIKKRNNSSKPLIFKKGVQTSKPLPLAQEKLKKVTNCSATDQFTQEVVKKVVTTMQNLLRKQVTATIPEIIKIVQKKSMEMNNMNKKNQMNKIINTAKHKVKTISKTQNNRSLTINNKDLISPQRRHKATKPYDLSAANKLTGTNKRGSTSTTKSETIPYKKAITKLMESFRFKRNALLDKETTTEMTRSKQVENITYTTPEYGELIESEDTNNTVLVGYYNYSVASITPIFYNTTIVNSFTEHFIVNIENITSEPQPLNNSNTVLDLAATESAFNDQAADTKLFHVLLDKIANANYLKFMEWSQMKKSQSNNTNIPLSLDSNNFSDVLNLATESKVKIHKYDIERKLDEVPKRFNITRVLSTKKLLAELEKKNTTNAKRKGKLNIVKYLKKFFRKLFSTTEIKEKYKTNNVETVDKKHTIKTLCTNFGPCMINKNNKAILQRKVKELDSEINLMMKSMNIIKGILRLLDFPIIDKPTNQDVKDEYNFRDSTQKLSIILKNQYSDPEYINKLSETQLTQIDYVKNNTQVFLESVARFVTIINDVIDILRSKVHEQRKSNSLDDNIIISTKQEPLDKLKKLLVKYNIVQNTFIKKMHEILSKFHTKKSSSDTELNESDLNANETNNSEAVDRFSNKILQNLKKLKTIAEALNSGSRKKRQIKRNDDAMVYLLMIMEYLMKKQQSVANAPVNDGIDLLIEAIQNAPDIKLLTKKVHTYTYVPSQKAAMRFGKKSSEDTDDSFYDSNTISKENNFTAKADISMSLFANQVVDEETYLNSSKYDSKVKYEEKSPSFLDINNSTEEKKQTIFTNAADVTSIPFKLAMKNKDKKEITDGNHLDDEHNNVDIEAEPNDGIVKRKFDVFVADYSDETDSAEIINATTKAPELLTNYSSQIMFSSTEDFKLRNMKMRHFNNDFITNGSVKFISKPKMQWVDTDDEEGDKSGFVKSSEETKTKPVTEALIDQGTSKKPAKISVEEINNFPKELREEYKKKLSKLNIDKVIFMKQLDLLNSLDYGTEGPAVDDSDSKDIKYSNDAYDML